MSTDTFLDMLTPTAQRQRNTADAYAHKPVVPDRTIGRPPYRAPSNNAPVTTPEARKATVRPDYADDIDAKVATLVSSGDVVFDTEADTYRRPHYRRYRFGSQS